MQKVRLCAGRYAKCTCDGRMCVTGQECVKGDDAHQVEKNRHIQTHYINSSCTKLVRVIRMRKRGVARIDLQS